MAFKRRKISVVGAGNTGTTTALMLAQKELGDIILVDIPRQERPTKGKALDMLQASAIQSFNVKITGTSDYRDTANSDLVIITAGMARKPGMSRNDLVNINVSIMQSVTKAIVEHSPDTYIIVLTNPVDIMTYTVFKQSGFPKNRVFGQSGVLDTGRFRTFVAEELNIAVEDITGFVLGGHGDEMVPLLRYSYAGGIPLEKLLPPETLERIVKRTRLGGGEIVELLGDGSAYYAPAASLVEMAEAVLKDKRRILPAIAYLEGEYGYYDMYLGVPTIIGGNGLEQVIELDLTEEEKAQLDKSAKVVRQVMEIVK